MQNDNDKQGIFRQLRERGAARARERRIQLEYHQYRLGQADSTGHVLMPLSDMRPGDQGHVLDLRGTPDVRQHLLELGFTPGTSVDIVRHAPMADPLTVRVRGYHLSLRQREADSILMRRCPPELIDPS